MVIFHGKLLVITRWVIHLFVKKSPWLQDPRYLRIGISENVDPLVNLVNPHHKDILPYLFTNYVLKSWSVDFSHVGKTMPFLPPMTGNGLYQD